jgi:hypothetical protein
MKTSKIIGTTLIVISLLIGYNGINKISESKNQINLLGLKIEASNESEQQSGYINLGVAIIIFAGGIYLANSKRK